MKKYLVCILFAAVLVCSCGLAVSASAQTEGEPAADKSIDEITYVMDDGASVSLSEENAKNGLRFSASMSEEDYTGLTANAEYTDISFGMFIMPYDYVSTGDLTEENLFGENAIYDWAEWNGSEWVYKGSKTRIINIVRSEMTPESDGKYHNYGVISNILDGNIARDFVGRGYIRYTFEGTVRYLLAEYAGAGQSANVRSVAYVAQLAVSAGAVTAEESVWLTENYLDKAITDTTGGDYAYIDLSSSAEYALPAEGRATRLTSENLEQISFTAGENALYVENAVLKPLLTKGENILYLHTGKEEEGNYIFGISKITVVAADMLLDTEDEFYEFIDGIRSGSAVLHTGQYIVMTGDMDMRGKGSWKDLFPENFSKGFGGTFDGRYHSVYGGKWGQAGMFGAVTQDAAVKNLNIVAPEILFGYSGVVVSRLAGTLENINVVVNGALSTHSSTQPTMDVTCMVSYSVSSSARLINVDVYRYDAPATDKKCSLWYTGDGSSVSENSGNDAYTAGGWTNKRPTDLGTDRALAAVTISGETAITTEAEEGSAVCLVSGTGVKAETGIKVSGGKITIDSADIDAQTFGSNIFFLEIEEAREKLYIPVTLAA